MTNQSSKERPTWSMTTKAMATGLLVAVMAAFLILVGQTAQAATTFIVNIPGDTHDADLGDGLCDVNLFGSGQQCTLRAAIEQANATPGADVINFNIPDTFGTGVKTINVGALDNSGLPPITDQVTINGYSQPGASPNTLARGTNANLLIELNGTDATFSDGLEIGDGGSGSLIKGLVINRFGNQGIDVFSLSDTLTNVKIEGNFVGTNPSGMEALGNGGDGIEMDAPNSVVGGSTPAKRNLISGNDVDGLSVSIAKDVTVEGNLVGTKADGIGALGNLFNGVDVCCSMGVSILRNSIFSNGQLGIDLDVDGRTPNDLGDADTGANALQNFPVITSAKTVSGKTTIKGKLNSRPNSGYLIQFFSNPSGDEGQKFIGQKSVTTDGSGNTSFTFTPSSVVKVGQTVTATATKDSNGNTSEFSAPRTVASS
jgi:trimeric autotransporter adhesin